jgi:hypothetical protein
VLKLSSGLGEEVKDLLVLLYVFLYDLLANDCESEHS